MRYIYPDFALSGNFKHRWYPVYEEKNIKKKKKYLPRAPSLDEVTQITLMTRPIEGGV